MEGYAQAYQAEETVHQNKIWFQMQDKKGLTLVEVLIAMTVLLLVSLAMMQTALLSIDSNMVNLLRDEAVNIAELRMSEARNTSFDGLTAGSSTATVNRNFRKIATVPFSVTRTVTDLNTDNKQITITVTWEWKEKTVANGNPYTHTITSIRAQI